MIDPLDIWIDEFEKLPFDTTGDQSPTHLTNYIDKRVTKKLDIDPATVRWDPPFVFTWQKSIFEATLRAISKVPSTVVIIPAIQIATGWQNSVLASSVSLLPGATMNPPAPGTNGITATVTTMLDPASIALGFTLLVTKLSGAVPVEKRKDAVLPKAIREAFTMLTTSTQGIDTTPPPAGPIPFVYVMTKVK